MAAIPGIAFYDRGGPKAARPLPGTHTGKADMSYGCGLRQLPTQVGHRLARDVISEADVQRRPILTAVR